MPKLTIAAPPSPPPFTVACKKAVLCCDTLQHAPGVSAHPLELNDTGTFYINATRSKKGATHKDEKENRTAVILCNAAWIRVSHRALKHMIRITFLPTLLEVVRWRLSPRHLLSPSCATGGNALISWCENKESNSTRGTDSGSDV